MSTYTIDVNENTINAPSQEKFINTNFLTHFMSSDIPRRLDAEPHAERYFIRINYRNGRDAEATVKVINETNDDVDLHVGKYSERLSLVEFNASLLNGWSISGSPDSVESNNAKVISRTQKKILDEIDKRKDDISNYEISKKVIRTYFSKICRHLKS